MFYRLRLLVRRGAFWPASWYFSAAQHRYMPAQHRFPFVMAPAVRPTSSASWCCPAFLLIRSSPLRLLSSVRLLPGPTRLVAMHRKSQVLSGPSIVMGCCYAFFGRHCAPTKLVVRLLWGRGLARLRPLLRLRAPMRQA